MHLRSSKRALLRAGPMMTLACCVLLAMLWASCDDDLGKASLIEPVYPEPCQFSMCTDSGECHLNEASDPICLCQVGYTGATCARCEPGFHRDARARCVTDKTCAEQPKDPCGANGDCSSDQGVIECTCEVGYEGPRCTLCSDRFQRDPAGRCLPLYIVAGDGGVKAMGAEEVTPCSPGYAGPQCTQCAANYHPFETGCVADDKCKADSCAKQGTCSLVKGIGLCTCQPGYSGTYCDSCAYGYHAQGNVCAADDLCRGDSCPAHASCRIVAGKITCPCAAGYEGASCAECAAGYHAANGQCVQDQTCQQLSCPPRASCSDAGGQARCACHVGYKGDRCDSCDTGYHAVGDACVADQKCEPSTCTGRATCRVVNGLTDCECQTGYARPGCTACGPGYHSVNGATCVADETCSASRCGPQGTCVVEAGATKCTCKAGWSGDRCETCVNLSTQTIDFQTGDGWATANDSCASSPALMTGLLTARSRAGKGNVLFCAPSSFNGIGTRHVELEAIADAPADLTFALPIVELSFDYGTRLTDLTLDVLADGVMVRSIHLDKKSKSSLSLQLSPAAKVITLRTSSIYIQNVGIDNVIFKVQQCQ